MWSPNKVEEAVSGYKFIHCHYLASGHDPGAEEWCTVGIVTKKVCPGTTDKKGNKFTIFSLSNLRDLPRVINVMAFTEGKGKTQLKFQNMTEKFLNLSANSILS